ncbi:MAG: endonuclease domain-containing protein [Acidaminococcaceae bacterium]|nr:endonuclease domain-containing protein [Acidaminococcaceae bacterium]
MTPWEGKLWFMYLRNYPIKFKRQVVMGRYIADFSCNAAKLIVELDGGGHYNPESQKYDEERTKFLEQNGYKVVRVLNSDIDKNLRGVCEFINREVRARI